MKPVFCVMALFALPASGWVTQMQSKYGVSNENMAKAFNGTSSGLQPMETMGYYWHWPKDADSNRGLGGGIQWAWDDELCKETRTDSSTNLFEDMFKEDFFFASFVTCKSIKASMHRAMHTWMDAHPFLHFIDVTEECRLLYGKVQSNCSLVELFITNRNNTGMVREHPKPWPYEDGLNFPWGSDPYAVCNVPGHKDCTTDVDGPAAGRRRLSPKSQLAPDLTVLSGRRRMQTAAQVAGDMPPEISSDISSGGAAASATQYGRYSVDLRATNGVYQKDSAGNPIRVIEAFGGIVSFNVEECWYLDSAFCAPLHDLKSRMGTSSAQAMLRGIAWGVFSLAAVVTVILILRVARHQHCCGRAEDNHLEHKCLKSMEELSSFGVLPLLALLTCLIVPISLEHNIFAPCWQCYDFEAAAVHEVGHILGLNHPDKMGTMEGHPVGCSSHNTKLASLDGIKPFLEPTQPKDLCKNPWKYSVCDAWPAAIEAGDTTPSKDEVVLAINPDTEVRNSIMEAFTEHNPQTCLTSDDLESLYMIYPMCTGRSMSVNTQTKWNCNKNDLNIGWVRVLVWIGVPVAMIFLGLIMTLSCLKHHDEHKHRKMEEKIVESKIETKTAQKQAKEQERRATVMADALQQQIATEDSRVEDRAQELAAEIIQKRMRGKLARQMTSGMMEKKRSEEAMKKTDSVGV